jgi:hypothetical protein
VRADPRLEWVGSRDVEAALRLTPERSRQLRQLIRLSHWWGGGSGFGQREWTVGVPLDLDDLPEHDVAAYGRQHVVTHFLPAAPGQGLTIRPVAPPAPPRSAFSFLADAALAERLAADWHEAQDVCQVRGWKSCVLLCGGILEATLQRMLCANGVREPAAGLSALIQAARGAGLLQDAPPLPRLVQSYATLLGPACVTPVTREDAEAALQAVRMCLRSLTPRV